MRDGEHVEEAVGRQPDHDDVADGAHSRPLFKWDPSEKHHCAHDVDDVSDLDVETTCDPLVQDVPRIEAKPCPHQQGQAGAEADQGAEEPHETEGEAHGPGTQRGPGSFLSGWHLNKLERFIGRHGNPRASGTCSPSCRGRRPTRAWWLAPRSASGHAADPARRSRPAPSSTSGGSRIGHRT